MKSKLGKRPMHYWLIQYGTTACGKDGTGTANTERVTCKSCKRTIAYKKAKENVSYKK